MLRGGSVWETSRFAVPEWRAPYETTSTRWAGSLCAVRVKRLTVVNEAPPSGGWPHGRWSKYARIAIGDRLLGPVLGVPVPVRHGALAG